MRVLLLTHRLPYAPNRGDRVRSFHIARILSESTNVDLVSLTHDADEASHAPDLRNWLASVTIAPVPKILNRVRGVCSLGSNRPLTHVLLDAPALTEQLSRVVSTHRPDVVLAYCSGMARLALEPLLRGIPFVLDMVDLDSAKWALLSENSRAPARWVYRREARLMSAFEALALRRAFSTLVVNERERAAASALAPEARVEVLGNGVDLEPLRPREPPSASMDVIFCGVMNYAPNEQAAMWLAREVWPLVRARYGTARLTLAGSEPTQIVRRLAADASIEVTGHVADVRPYLWRSAVSAAPLQMARGVQNKVLEAAAAGLPVVITSAVAGGLPPGVLPACRVADDPAAFAAAIIDLLGRTPTERRELATRADLLPLTWDKRLAPLRDLLAEAAAS